VVEEILYDNMKTAFVCDTEGRFHPNKRLLGFAAYYGFVPKRCQVYRPQTKGKVERSIGYLSCNFWPRVRGLDLCLEELNEAVQGWLKEIDRKEIRELGESRERRFEYERQYLIPLPSQPYDWREVHELIVSRESCITFETNRYSVPPRYIGQSLTLKVDRLSGEAALFCASGSIRSYQLERKGACKRIMLAEDVREINELWLAQYVQRVKRIANRGVKPRDKGYEVQVRPPAVYEKLFAELPEEAACRS
jgi:hypothetical protein